MLDVLIVEDDLMYAEELADSLKQFNCKIVGIASNVADAIRIFDNEKPNLVMLDIELENDDNGFEVAKHILKTNIVPMIYLSQFFGNKYKHYIQSSIRLQASNYLPKGTFVGEQLWHFILQAMDEFAESNGIKLEGYQYCYASQGKFLIRRSLEENYYRILPHEIIYLEVKEKRYIRLHTTKSSEFYEFLNPLDKFLKYLNIDFLLRASRQSAVNINYIQEISTDSKKIILANGVEIDLGSTYKKKLLSIFKTTNSFKKISFGTLK